MAPRTASPISIWKAPTSIAAGSIHRMLQACGTKGRAPYRGVLTHGFTLDEKGMKMSKSLGNTVAPQEVIERIRRRYPAALGGAVRLHRRSAHRQGNPERDGRQLSPPAQHDALPAGQPRGLSRGRTGRCPTDMPELERWVLHRLAELDVEVRKGYAKL